MKKSLSKLFTALLLVILLSTTVLSAEFVFIESESGQIDGMLEKADAEAYGGKYITSDDVEKSVNYTFEIPKDGKYTAWFRVYATSDTDNSIFFSVDGDTYDDGSQWIFDLRENSEYEVSPDEKYLDPDYNNPQLAYERWYWLRLSYRDAAGSPVTRFNTKLYDLTAGTHTLYIQSREAGARIDKIFFTDDLDYNPNNVTGDPEAAIIAINTPPAVVEDPIPEESSEPVVNEPVVAAETEAETVNSAPSTGDYSMFIVIAFVSSALLIIITVKKRIVKQ